MFKQIYDIELFLYLSSSNTKICQEHHTNRIYKNISIRICRVNIYLLAYQVFKKIVHSNIMTAVIR